LIETGLFELHLRSWGLPIDLQSVRGFDGFEMLRALRASGAISDLEIIVVTVLFKPLRSAELRQRLRQLLEQRKHAAV
jgi:DNA-binding response OmpR family regulator